MLVQADHTIVAPGPLVGHLAAALEAFTEVESTGGATVYRISVASVQRGLEGGASAEEMLDLLRRSSLTEVPQPVEYLINDTADRHGRIRVHGPAAVVVTSDAAELDLVVAALTKSELRLRRVADTVALSEQPGSRLLAALRSAGWPQWETARSGSIRARSGGRVCPAPVGATALAARTGSARGGARSGAGPG